MAFVTQPREPTQPCEGRTLSWVLQGHICCLQHVSSGGDNTGRLGHRDAELGFSDGPVVKNLPAIAGDMGSVPNRENPTCRGAPGLRSRGSPAVSSNDGSPRALELASRTGGAAAVEAQEGKPTCSREGPVEQQRPSAAKS